MTTNDIFGFGQYIMFDRGPISISDPTPHPPPKKKINKKINKNSIPTFGIRIAPTLNSAGIKVRNIHSNSILNIPPWTIKQPEVPFTLTTDKKGNYRFIHL